MTAIIFPGQGSQYTGMSMDFNQNFEVSRRVFQEIEEYTKLNIRNIIAKNDNNELNQTNYTQVSIFAASIVIFKTLINEFGLDKINPKIVLGHSLGEYSALVANNSLSLKNASILIKIRGNLMNSAIKPNISGMAAIIGTNSKNIENIIKKNNLNIEVANDNSPMQVVISGLIKDINTAENFFLSEGVKRYIKLNVSAAFHSKYMLEAQQKLNNNITETEFLDGSVPIISNYNSLINSNKNDIIDSLKNQMANKVRWTESIKKLEETEINHIIEIGPGKILSGLISRISKKFVIKSIDKIEDMKKITEHE